MTQRVVVIGAMGMLGRVVFSRLRDVYGLHAIGTYNRASPLEPSGILIPFDVTGSDASLTEVVSRGDILVNCVVSLSSAIKKEGDPSALLGSIQVNSVFPKRLAKEAERQGARVIHISSDAVFSGRTRGPFSEDSLPDPADLYGVSKFLGEDSSTNSVNIRTSLVGFDTTYHRGLLEWFLSHTAGSSAKGYVNHLWQGVTTIQLADLIASLVQRGCFDDIRREGSVHHFCPNEAVSKFELLTLFNRVFEREVVVEPITAVHGDVDRRLETKFTALRTCYKGPVGLEAALRDLRESSL